MLKRKISAFTVKYSARNIDLYASAYRFAYSKNLACSLAIHLLGSVSESRRATMTWSSLTVSPAPVALLVDARFPMNPRSVEVEVKLLW
jgi:hypothetical protein